MSVPTKSIKTTNSIITVVGTHLMWEIMTMLQRGSAESIKEPKELIMLEMVPITKSDKIFPSPRVINTHLRLDVLPKEFRGRKTVWGNIKHFSY